MSKPLVSFSANNILRRTISQSKWSTVQKERPLNSNLQFGAENLQSAQMLTSWHTVLEIVLRTTAVYALVLVGIRLTGKREVGQMTPFDLTLLLLLSNSVQNAMTGPDNSLMGGVAAAIVLLTLNFLLAEVSGLNRRFRKMVQGSPTLLIHNGACITSHMAKEHISMDELNRALREHGVACIGDAALAVLEVDGSISVLKYDDVPDKARPQKRLKFLHRN
jgi:uncharacterized membrane protein YcaP (DUF421 family)